jgi:hypothetical protein
MVIDVLKIVHLGTPDSETGLTDIAKGLKEIFKNDADAVYVQSAEISELFAKTREIMRLVYNPVSPDVDVKSYPVHTCDDTHEQIKAIFHREILINIIDLSNIRVKKSDHQELDNLKNLFRNFVNFTHQDDCRINRVDFKIRPEHVEPFLHEHNQSPYKRFFKYKEAEILFSASEDPKLTTRIVPEYSTADRIPENFSRCSTVSAPQDAIILMRNGGSKPNPIHGTPEKPSDRFTFLASVSPV